jgi:predicted ATPase
MAQGLSDRQIADRIALSVHTVKWYNRGLFAQLGATSRSHAIALARDASLLGLPDAEAVAHAPSGNLPAAATSFVGRERELTEVQNALSGCRLLTLSGAPGSGKTRLALELARSVAGQFEGGAWFVALAPVTRPARVLVTIAEVLGVAEVRGRSILETLQAALKERRILLVLDNFEHVLDAAVPVGKLLEATPALKVLATSREALGLYAEQVHLVPPLGLDESTELFVQRARAVRPHFALSDENRSDVERVCQKLEGLPLSIELAAARTKLWSPRALLTKLDQRLSVLSVSTRDLPSRQQTLRNTIAWSFSLLNGTERRVLATMSVFRGSTSTEDVESILGAQSDGPLMATLEALLNKNLLQSSEGESGNLRVLLLETIREYALEQADQNELSSARELHAAHFAAMAWQAQGEFRSAGCRPWIQRLDEANHNLEAALEWLLARPDPTAGVAMVHALRDYWIASGRFLEGDLWCKRALAVRAQTPRGTQARLLADAAFLAFYAERTGSTPAEDTGLDEALTLAEAEADAPTLAWALTLKGVYGIGQPRRHAAALRSTLEGVRRFRALNDAPGEAQALCVVGELARNHDDDAAAETAYQDCLAVVRQTGEVRRESMVLTNLGFVQRHRGLRDEARRLFFDGAAKALEFGYDASLLASPIFSLAGILAEEGDGSAAARLLGATEQLLRTHGVGVHPGDHGEYEREQALVRGLVDASLFEPAYEEGRRLSLSETLSLLGLSVTSQTSRLLGRRLNAG